MPEGPSIFHLKQQVEKFIGQKVTAAEGNGKKIDADTLVGLQVKDVKTFGKEFLICFPEFTVRAHFLLFGSWLIDGRKNGKLTLGLTFKNGELNLYSTDAYLIDKPLDEVYDWSSDVMHKSFDGDKAVEKLKKQQNSLICDSVLDQDIFAGIGNKMKDEVLWDLAIHPESLVKDVPHILLQRIPGFLIEKSFAFLKWEKNGRPEGFLKIHNQKVCPRDNTPITKKTIGKAKRNTSHCLECQKLY